MLVIARTQNVTDGQTDGRTKCIPIIRSTHSGRGLKKVIKGPQLRYDTIDYKKVVTMTSLTLSEYTFSESQMIHWWTRKQ